MIIRDRQEVGLAFGQPLLRRRALALRAMPVAAGNGRCPLPALWAKPVMGAGDDLIAFRRPSPLAQLTITQRS